MLYPSNIGSYVYNRRQNDLRHFALNWAFLCFTDFKSRKYSFSSPIPSLQCCADVRVTHRKQQTRQLWMERSEEGCGVFCSLKLPYLSKKEMHSSPRRVLSKSQNWPAGPVIFDNEIGFFKGFFFLLKNHLLPAYYLGFDWSAWIVLIKNEILATTRMVWPCSSDKWKELLDLNVFV